MFAQSIVVSVNDGASNRGRTMTHQLANATQMVVLVLLMAIGTIQVLAAPREQPLSEQGVSDTTTVDEEVSDEEPAKRLREGSVIENVMGEFHDTGDRIIFQTADRKSSFPTLENLALERIARTLEQSAGSAVWSVTGTVTEFRGVNYLLVKQAVMKAKSTGSSLTTPELP